MRADRESRADIIFEKIRHRSDMQAAFDEIFGAPGKRSDRYPLTLRDAVRRRLDEYRWSWCYRRPNLALSTLPARPEPNGQSGITAPAANDGRPNVQQALVFSSDCNNPVNQKLFLALREGTIYRVQQSQRSLDFTGIFLRKGSCIDVNQWAQLRFETGGKIVQLDTYNGEVIVNPLERKPENKPGRQAAVVRAAVPTNLTDELSRGMPVIFPAGAYAANEQFQEALPRINKLLAGKLIALHQPEFFADKAVCVEVTECGVRTDCGYSLFELGPTTVTLRTAPHEPNRNGPCFKVDADDDLEKLAATGRIVLGAEYATIEENAGRRTRFGRLMRVRSGELSFEDGGVAASSPSGLRVYPLVGARVVTPVELRSGASVLLPQEGRCYIAVDKAFSEAVCIGELTRLMPDTTGNAYSFGVGERRILEERYLRGLTFIEIGRVAG